MADDNRIALALNGYGLAGADERLEVLPWAELRQLVATAEEVGYATIFMPESASRDTVATLTGLSGATSRIGLASGVLPIAARDLRRTAMGAATVQEISGGRFTLGLGSDAPIARTRAAVTALRDLLAGAPARDPEGTELRPIDLLPDRPVPIALAALGPRMAELAGEMADLVLLNWCTPDRVARAREEVARGAERAGRDPGTIRIGVYVRTLVGADEGDAVAALGEAAGRYAAMPAYLRQFEAMGLGAEARAAATAVEVPLALVRETCAWGTREEALAGLARFHDAGADVVVAYPVPVLEAASSTMGTILGAAPSPAVER